MFLSVYALGSIQLTDRSVTKETSIHILVGMNCTVTVVLFIDNNKVNKIKLRFSNLIMIVKP